MRRYLLVLLGVLWLAGLAGAAPPKAIVANEATMVPLRAFADWFGAQVTIDARRHQVIYQKGDYVLKMTAGSVQANLEGEDCELLAPPIEQDGVLYFPLCILAFDRRLQVTGDAKAGTLVLTHPEVKTALTFTASAAVVRTWQDEAEKATPKIDGDDPDDIPDRRPERTPPAAPPPANPYAGMDKVTPLAAGWDLHRHGLGFQLKCPHGWQVTTDGSQIVVQDPAQQAGVLIMPFLLKQPAPAEQTLRQVLAVFGGNFPQAKVSAVKQVRKQPDEVAGTITFTADGQPGQANLLCSQVGRSGMLFAIAAPRAQFAARRPVLLGVLKSFSFTAPAAALTTPAAGKAPKIAYQPWKDPRERAFTVEVPRGWQVTGGLNRRHAIDCYHCVRVTSPDGRITVSFSDPNLRAFTSPLPQFGYPEGALYPGGNGLVQLCKTYLPGAAFAAEYARTKLGAGLQHLVLTPPRDRTDASAAINRKFTEYNLPMRYATGDVTFSGTRNGVPMRGYCFAGDYFSSVNPSGPYVWAVDSLYAYLAPAAQEATAQAVLTHMVKTFRIDPGWQQRQSGVTMRTVEIERQKNEAITSMINGAFAYRSAVQDNASRQWSNTTLGQTDVRDPNTGETWKVASGHNWYWRRGDTIAGTATHDRPDIDFTPLEQW